MAGNSQKEGAESALKLDCQVFPYRLGESQTDQGSVKEACAQNVQCVEADRVPHTNMRSQLLPGEKNKIKNYTTSGTAAVKMRHFLNLQQQ